MTSNVQLYRDGDRITLAVGANLASMSIGEWSKLIVNPKSPKRFDFESESLSTGVHVLGTPSLHASSLNNLDLPSDCERKD